MADSEFNLNPNIPQFSQDDHEMADALPRRKMFSTIPVSDAQYTEDNRGTSMAGIRALAKAAKVGPKGPKQKVVPSTPRQPQKVG